MPFLTEGAHFQYITFPSVEANGQIDIYVVGTNVFKDDPVASIVVSMESGNGGHLPWFVVTSENGIKWLVNSLGVIESQPWGLCESCRGAGSNIADTCPDCNGTGYKAP